MLPRSAIQKGRLLEQFVVQKLRDKGLDLHATRTPGSGNGTHDKADISTSAQVFGRNLGIEAKNQKTLASPEWWRQTEKLSLLGQEPVLVFKFPREHEENAKVVIYLDTFLDLVKAAREPKKADEGGRELRYQLRIIKEAAKRILRLLGD